MEDKDIPVFRLLIDDESIMKFISIVDEPAIEVMGHYFSKNKSEYKFKVNSDDKMIILGPAIIPDIKIYREDNEIGPHYVYFTKEDISKLVEIFNSNLSNKKINFNHTNKVLEAYILEDWIIEDKKYDKSKLYGFDLPVGTYMIKVKIMDEIFWNEYVKDKGFFGFSIETFCKSILQFSKKSIDDLNIDLNNISDSELLEILLKSGMI